MTVKLSEPVSLKYIILFFSVLFVLSTILHWRVFSLDLMGPHVWRQTHTQSTIDNFYEEDFNILNPTINDRGNRKGLHRMEFPVMQWLFAGAYKIFGDSIALTRILSLILSFLSAIGFCLFLKYLFKNDWIALLGAWAFTFSPVIYYYAVNPLPDNFALFSGIWALALFLKWIKSQKTLHIILASLFFSLAALSKLPFLVYLGVPAGYFIYLMITKKKQIRLLDIFIIFLGLLGILAWYSVSIPSFQENKAVSGILGFDLSTAEVFDIIFHVLTSLLPELLINYASFPLFLAGLFFIFRKKWKWNLKTTMFSIWILGLMAYYIFEFHLIGKEHDYYFFPFLPLLFTIVAYSANTLVQKFNFAKWVLIFLMLIMPLTAFLRSDTRWNPDKPGFNIDLLTHKDNLRSIIPKDALVIAGNDITHFVFFYYIDKKGWVFAEDEMNGEAFEEMITEGAEYFYCDTREVDEDPDIRYFLKEKILEAGSIRVYKLTE